MDTSALSSKSPLRRHIAPNRFQRSFWQEKNRTFRKKNKWHPFRRFVGRKRWPPVASDPCIQQTSHGEQGRETQVRQNHVHWSGQFIQPSTIHHTPTGYPFVISLKKESSFGGGEHPSTRTAVRLLDGFLYQSPLKSQLSTIRAVDIGTGPGVLAVVTAKIGVGFVWGFGNALINLRDKLLIG